MITSNNFTLEERNIYVRYLIRLLNKKYDVTQSKMALKIGVNGNYFRDFAGDRRNIGADQLNKIEDYLLDLYEGIFMFEIPQNKTEFKEFVGTLEDSDMYYEYVKDR